jgi:hypothetical protein
MLTNFGLRVRFSVANEVLEADPKGNIMLTSAGTFSAKTWSVVVGVARYDSTVFPPLPNAASDAASLSAALKSQEGPSVPADHVTCLAGSVKKESVLQALRDTVSKSGEDDILLFYFAGHGLHATSDQYLCCGDTIPEDPRSGGISVGEIEEVLSTARTRGVLIVLDCCYGGAFGWGGSEYFRHLSGSDFRIILSASQATEKAWDLPDGEGTLFSRHFVAAANGSESVGRTPGLVYFSELVAHLDSAISDDRRHRYRDMPDQHLLVIGTYLKDPLVFTVGKRLTSRQLAFRSARYSRRYIQRLLFRIAAAMLVSGSVATGLVYTYLEHRQYVTTEDGAVTIYQGHSGWHLLGFPKRLFTFDFDRHAIDPWDETRDAIVLDAGYNKPALPVLRSKLHPAWLFQFDDWAGDNVAAREEFWRYVGDLRAPKLPPVRYMEPALDDLSTTADIGKLESIVRLQTVGLDQRQAALVTLAKFDQKLAMDLAASDSLLYVFPEHLIDALGVRGDASIKALLGRQILGDHSESDDGVKFDLFQAARLDAKYKADELAKMILESPRENRVPLLVSFAYFLGIDKEVEGQLAAAIVKAQGKTPPSTEIIRRALYAISFMSTSGDHAYCWSIRQDNSVPEGIRLAAALVECRKTSKSFAAIAAEYRLSRLEFGMMARRRAPTSDDCTDALAELQAKGESDAAWATDLLLNIRTSDARTLQAVATRAISFSSPALRAAALSTLRRNRAQPMDLRPFLADKDVAVQDAALRWSVESMPASAESIVAERVSGGNVTLTVLLICPNVPLGTRLVHAMRSQLDKGNEDTRCLTSGIWAMTGGVDDVVRCLSHADPAVRRGAVAYAARNPRFFEIVDAYTKSRPPFPSPVARQLTSQRRRMSRLLDEVERVGVEHRHWLAKLFVEHSTYPPLSGDSGGVRLFLYDHYELEGR